MLWAGPSSIKTNGLLLAVSEVPSSRSDSCSLLEKAFVVRSLALDTSFILQPLLSTYNEPGGPFHIEKLKADDLKAGLAKCSWLPTVDHPGIPHEQAEALAPMLVSGMLLSISTGALQVTDEWNRLLPDYQFTQAEEFLAEAWRDKP